MALRTADFDFHLPPELIAARPLAGRADSRMLVLDRRAGTIRHRRFCDLPALLQAGDLLVLNDTRVIPARVFSNDGTIELLFLDQPAPDAWRCLVRPGKKMKPGRTVQVGGSTGTVVEIAGEGARIVRWDRAPDLAEFGRLALPHYLGRDDEPADRDRYQTVYARAEGAIAAPTAGLHFTPEILALVPHDFLTLHVGVGTFRPVSVADPKDHAMHPERYSLRAETVARINAATRVMAVGTTVTRTLETVARETAHGTSAGRLAAGDHAGETNAFIYPPYRFRVVDALLTNFHLPRSTLIMLVCAFGGHRMVLEAYRQAVAEGYRFYSYGDCMLIV
jgi:S-adenosylmethionine:tRNA ribosyltransferase-isomerase